MTFDRDRHCEEPTGPREARPDDRLFDETIQSRVLWLLDCFAAPAMTIFRSARLNAGVIALVVAVACAIPLTAVLHAHWPAAAGVRIASASGISAQDSWSEESWPFPIDQWGTGRAFACLGGACGAELHLYLRAKIGFCRCATGVADDDEIDRVGDTALFGSNYQPLLPGHAVDAGVLKGRARQFAVRRSFATPVPVLTIALANRCDAVVATVAADSELSSAQESAALDFLRGDQVQRWAAASTGSQ